MRKEGLDLLDRQNNRGLSAFRSLTYVGDGIVDGPFPTNRMAVEGAHDVPDFRLAAWRQSEGVG